MVSSVPTRLGAFRRAPVQPFEQGAAAFLAANQNVFAAFDCGCSAF